MKLLLTSVFGPYGVDDDFGRKENIMEVLHNQVTREQGVFSMRFNQESYGLYLIAENLSIPTVILDFPSRQRFIREIKKGYDYIGIAFITPNFKKAAHMTQLIRQFSPRTKIILGGHGTAIEDIAKKISCDFVCRGEGVRFMRELFGEDPEAPIKHPIRYSSFNRFVLGAPIFNNMVPEGSIMAGVGCPNGCRFCATSHFFYKKYIPFLRSGADFFNLCREYEDKMGITDFFVLDENFLKSEQRSRELLALMEAHDKPYSFSTFSSAEAIMKVGVDFVQRIGIDFLWIGVESCKEIYEKNRGINFPKLVKDLRDRGIAVLTSGILFLEHHTKTTIHDDIDFLIHLKPDFIQYSQLCPSPDTPVFHEYTGENKILPEIPYEEWHGQHKIYYQHPEFTMDESEVYLREAFKKDFAENSPSILRMADTYLRSAMATDPAVTDPADIFMKLRHKQRLKNALDFYSIISVLVPHAPTPKAKAYAQEVRHRYQTYFGKRTLQTVLYSAALQITIIKEKIRSKLVQNNMRQPKTLYTRYRLKKT
jgi:radical SAM superfamily enzyme YgiQ (UPF0313 family)